MCGASGDDRDGNGDECVGVPFIFDARSWNITQVVRITRVDDVFADGDQTHTFSGTARSRDPDCDGIHVNAQMSFDFYNVDDDVAGISFNADTVLEVKAAVLERSAACT